MNAPRPGALRACAALLALAAPAAASSAVPPPAGTPPAETPPAGPSPAARGDLHPQEPGHPDPAELERERRRIFRLAGGEVLRAKARFQGGRWELRLERAWQPLDPAEIESWRDERDVLAEARRLEQELGIGARGAHERARVELAGWMLAEGLLAESLDQLDRVLREEPDHDAARALLARHPRPPEMPAREAILNDPGTTLPEILSLGTHGGPARAELVIAELGRLFKPESLEKLLEHSLRSGSNDRRAFAALALRRLLPGGALRELYRRAALDPVDEVRRGAAFAIRDLGEPGLVLPLVRALESEHAAVRTFSAESLGNMGFPEAAPALLAHLGRVSGARSAAAQAGGAPRYGMSGSLHLSRQLAYVRDYDLEIAQAASIADPVIGVTGEAVLLDVRLGGISGFRPVGVARERRTVVRALEQITGASPGSTFDDWDRWWDER